MGRGGAWVSDFFPFFFFAETGGGGGGGHFGILEGRFRIDGNGSKEEMQKSVRILGRGYCGIRLSTRTDRRLLLAPKPKAEEERSA